MQISYNWLREYIGLELPAEEVAEVLTSIGLEVEAIEQYEPVPGGLRGVVVGEVLECHRHPDADRLKLTRVDVGAGEPLSIVCGAPNVSSGQKVLVATIGTKLHPVGGEPVTIRKGKIRGAESHGMICAEDELGLGSGHEGIMILPDSAIPGTPAAECLGLRSDLVFAIGLTPNRTDAFSHVGVARELSAALRWMEGGRKRDLPVILPDVAMAAPGAAPAPIVAAVEDSIRCPRYMTLFLEGISNGPSPGWMQDRLRAIGLRPVNAVVDITNYVQHEIGQPLHAFDADRISGSRIVVRTARAGEAFVTLDGVERSLSADDLVIADAEKPMCLAGIFGGQHSGVSEATTRVVLESAWFQASAVRRSARRHGLHTDASFRFERGSDPSAVPWALLRAAALMVEITGAGLPARPTDHYPAPAQPAEVLLRMQRLHSLVGKAIPADHVKSILRALGFDILAETAEGMHLRVPLCRVEVTREADVIEEVLRIYGYDRIETPRRMHSALSAAPKPDPEEVYERVAHHLASSGFHEIMGMSLTRERYAELPGGTGYGSETSVALLNPLSSDLGILRQSLLFGSLQAVALNQNFKHPDVSFFELGKVYHRNEAGFSERRRLMLLMTGRRWPQSWNRRDEEVDFTDLKSSLEKLMHISGLAGWKVRETTHPALSYGLAWAKTDAVLLDAGLVRSEVLREFDIRQPVWYADVDWDLWLSSLPAEEAVYRAPDKYPAVRRDLSLLLDASVTFSQVEAVAFRAVKHVLRQVNLFDVYTGKGLPEGKKSYAVSFILQDASRTMTDHQVEQHMSQLLKALESELGAALRQQA